MPDIIKIIIVEDHPIFRMGMKELINREKDLEVVGDAETVAGALDLIEIQRPNLVIVDEADLVTDLARLMRSVKPTIDAGGRMVLLSRSDKGKPLSLFKRMYRAAAAGLSGWKSVFLPWKARPGRTQAWYDALKTDTLSNTGSLDDLHEQYPETDAEALAPRTQDKRIPAAWLNACYAELAVLKDLAETAPSLPGFEVYRAPEPGKRYVIGIDPAEGNPTSDDSALEIQELKSGEQVARLSGKFQPAVIAAYADAAGRFFNSADVMVERNNHGHAVLLWLLEHSSLRVLPGHDGRPGWLSNQLGKTMLYDAEADSFRTSNTLVHSLETFVQIASIEGSTLLAQIGRAHV